MNDLNTMLLVVLIFLCMGQLFVVLNKRLERNDLENIVHIFVQDRQTGHVDRGRIDLRENWAVFFEKKGLTFIAKRDKRNPDNIGIKITWENGNEYGVSFSNHQATLDHDHFRFVFVRYNCDVSAVMHELETDYFGTNEGPEFPPPVDTDQVSWVAESPT